MANDPRYYDESPLEQVPNYKILFMGACTLITILFGILYGIWSSRAEQAAENSRATNELQWQRLQQLGEKLLEESASIKQLQREGDDREMRLRKLEEWRYGKH